MPRSIPKTDFSSIQSAIQDAFNTFWRVREGREQRGENEKDRQARMQELMMSLQSGRLTASERNRAEQELERMRQQGATKQADIEYNRPGQEEARTAALEQSKAYTSYLGRIPQAPGNASKEEMANQSRLLWPKIAEEMDIQAKGLFNDIILTPSYVEFSKKHVGMMNEEEYKKLKSKDPSSQSKWALDKAIEIVSPKYRPLYVGSGIEKEYESYLAGFKAKWQPNLAEMLTPQPADKGLGSKIYDWMKEKTHQV